MITYSDLYEALRREKYNEKLQKLPKNFLAQIEIYFREKKESSEKIEDSIFGDEIIKAKKQLENAKSILRELLVLRHKKILSLSLLASSVGVDKKDIDNMLESEKKLLEITTANLEKNKKELDLILSGVKKKDLKNQMIRFVKDVPNFLDDNNLSLGPFKKGDVANLPKDIASILTGSGQADTIEE